MIACNERDPDDSSRPTMTGGGNATESRDGKTIGLRR